MGDEVYEHKYRELLAMFRRNFESIRVSAQTDREAVFALTERMAAAERTITMQQQTIAQLQQQVAVLTALGHGRGSTVR